MDFHSYPQCGIIPAMEKHSLWVLLGLALLFLIACRLPWSPAAAPSLPQNQASSGRHTLLHDGRVRSYELYLPNDASRSEKIPLVIALHGAPGYGANMAEFSGLRELAESEGFIALFPDGTSWQDPHFLNWNAGTCCGYATDNNIDDLGFLRRLIERAIADYNADAERVYLAGFSKGGMMAYYFACRHAEHLAGIAVIAGAFNLTECNPSRSLDVLIVHGRLDEAIPYGGDIPRTMPMLRVGEDRPVAYAVEFWRRVNHCHALDTKTTKQYEITDFACFRSALRLIALPAEGHTWPGAREGLVGAMRSTSGFSVNRAMWEFWQKQE